MNPGLMAEGALRRKARDWLGDEASTARPAPQHHHLVCCGTDPAWTPLFLQAGALVMESGGAVSHGSIVAREYGLPAVAGVADATTRLKHGQRVRVDGQSGQDVVLNPAP